VGTALRFALGTALLGLMACGSGDKATALAARGEMLFSNPQEGGNTLACMLCHARSEPAPDGFRRPGHPLLGAGGRASFKAYEGRTATRFVEAINVCLNQWMIAPLWTEDDARYVAVHAYLEVKSGIDDSPADLLHPIIESAPADLGGGDPSRGAALFDVSCAICHGMGATGTSHAPILIGRSLLPEYIGRRVRTSGLQSNADATPFAGGRMPFWSVDRLSDDELRDLVAFIAR
jgi:cytochrome c